MDALGAAVSPSRPARSATLGIAFQRKVQARDYLILNSAERRKSALSKPYLAPINISFHSADETDERDWRGAMELHPVEGVRPVSRIGVQRSASGVTPPFAVDGTDRAEEDTSRRGAKQQDRGLEEDLEDSLSEEATIEFTPKEAPKKVDCFA